MFDRVISLENLHLAFKQVKRNGGAPGMDGQTVEQFEACLEENLQRLHWELQSGNYRPRPGKRSWRPKPGQKEERPLVIPAVRDRVVQTALYLALEPIFEGLL